MISILPDPKPTSKVKAVITGPTDSAYAKNALLAAIEGLARNGIDAEDLTNDTRMDSLAQAEEVWALHGWMADAKCVADVAVAQAMGKPVKQTAIIFEQDGGNITVKMANGPDAVSIVALVKLVGGMNPAQADLSLEDLRS